MFPNISLGTLTPQIADRSPLDDVKYGYLVQYGLCVFQLGTPYPTGYSAGNERASAFSESA
jgi:hypothetical protein